MKFKWLLSRLIIFSFIVFFCKPVFAKTTEEEIAELKSRISALEQKLTQQEAKLGEQQELKENLDKIKNVFEGLSIGTGATFVVQGTHNANAISNKEDVADASYSIDLEIEKEFKDVDGRAFMHLETGQGAGVEDELKVFSNVNKDANTDESVKIAEVYYEQNLLDKKITLTFGKLDSTCYIDDNTYANDETTQFLGRIFKNSPVIEFPDNSFGLRLGLAPIDLFDMELGIFDADADWEDAFDSVFLGSQINFKPKLLERTGNYRVYGWLNDKDHIKWDDALKTKEKSYGFGLSFDQEIADVFGAFARYGWQSPKVYLSGSSFSLEQSYSLGLQLKGNPWKRKDDILGLAFGGVIPSDDYKKANNLKAKSEEHLEIYYNFKLNEHLCLSPDLQVIWDPYGGDAINGDKTIFVGGVRAQVDF